MAELKYHEMSICREKSPGKKSFFLRNEAVEEAKASYLQHCVLHYYVMKKTKK